MADIEKIQVEVLNLDADKLTEGAKFIFLLHPKHFHLNKEIHKALTDLIGSGNYILLPLEAESFKAYEIVKQATGETPDA